MAVILGQRAHLYRSLRFWNNSLLGIAYRVAQTRVRKTLVFLIARSEGYFE